jgi:asparagine synthase (glutamine-hydrolysing)
MCGIIGAINIEKSKIEKGLNKLHHRGPDAQQIYSKDGVTLGHARLSILDLNQGANQPFRIDNEIIVFNGEIYNYKLLKSLLESKGISFNTTSDTEVLLQWLINEGIEGIKDVEGMFAFAWYSENYGRLILCRDQLGIKPFYIYRSESKLLFCSEINALLEVAPDLKEIDQSQIVEFLLNGFLYEPDTGFKNIFKIKPGSYEVYNLNTDLIETSEYWNINSAKSSPIDINQLDNLIDKSINEHLVADVPVGLFFSGGIDSSIILSKIKTGIKPITIKSTDLQYKNSGMSNDYSYAKQVAEIIGVQLDEVELNIDKISNDEFLALVNDVSIGNEELMYDFTYQSSKIVSKYAQSKGYKVMLSGMGADELFAGYPRYRLLKYSAIFKVMQPFLFLLEKNKWFAKKIDRFANFYAEDDFAFKYAALVGVFGKKEVQELTENSKIQNGFNRYAQKIHQKLSELNGQSNLKKALFLDLTGFLSHNFSVADKSSMQASIELRVPLATKGLLEFAWQLKDRQLISFRRSKKPLRCILLKKLPKSIVDRKKAGFNAPLDDFINRIGKEKTIEVLKSNELFCYLKESKVESILNDHFAKKRNNTYQIYQLIYLSFWLKNFAN